MVLRLIRTRRIGRRLFPQVRCFNILAVQMFDSIADDIFGNAIDGAGPRAHR